MKSVITRVTIRPGKSVAVNSEVIARARGALEAFGVTEADLERLAAFKGDVTIGPAQARRGSTAGLSRREVGKDQSGPLAD